MHVYPRRFCLPLHPCSSDACDEHLPTQALRLKQSAPMPCKAAAQRDFVVPIAMANEQEELQEGTLYWKVHECPEGLDCTAQSWERAAVWGWSEEECKAKLLHHLQRSSHHANTFNAHYTAEACADGAYYSEQVLSQGEADHINTHARIEREKAEAREAERAEAQAHKRARKAEPDAGMIQMQQQLQQLKHQVKNIQKPSQPAPAIGAGGGGRPSSAPADSQLALFGVVRSGTVTMRISELQVISDSIKRAHTAAMHSQKLSSAASQAFGNEAVHLAECLQVIEATITAHS